MRAIRPVPRLISRPTVVPPASTHRVSSSSSSGATEAADGRITAPNLAELGKDMLADIHAMTHAVEAGAPAEGEAAANRLSALKTEDTLGSLSDIQPDEIAKLAGVSEANGDSLHRLVMDMHKTLNRLAAGFAEETVQALTRTGSSLTTARPSSPSCVAWLPPPT